MGKIYVNSTCIMDRADFLEQKVNELRDISDKINSIRNGLSWKIPTSDVYKNHMKTDSENIRTLSERLENMVILLNTVITECENLESSLTSVEVASKTSNYDTGSTASVSSEYIDNATDIMDMASDLFGESDSDILSFLSAGIGLNSALVSGLSQGDNSPWQTSSDVCSVIKNLLNTVKAGEKLRENVPATTLSGLGIAAAGAGFVSEMLNLPNHDSAWDAIKDSGSLIGAGGGVIKAAEKFYIDKTITHVPQMLQTSLDEKEIAKQLSDYKKGYTDSFASNLDAGIAAGRMLLTGATTFYEKYTDDGSFSSQDAADTFLATGVEGMSSMVSSMTGGIVSLDTQKTVDIYQQNTKAATDWIANTGAPTWAQVAMTVPGTVVVAAESTVQSFVQYGYDLGENIKKLFS